MHVDEAIKNEQVIQNIWHTVIKKYILKVMIYLSYD